jgi:DNA polymerase III delta prime subunit
MSLGVAKQDETLGEIIQNLVGTFNVQTLLEEQKNKNARRFKVLVILHAETLTLATQNLLKELMEKYITSFRVILHVNNILMIEKSLREQCLLFNARSPSLKELELILQEKLKEKKHSVDEELCQFIAELSNKNISLALSILQHTYEKKSEEGPIVPAWMLTFQKIVTLLMKTPPAVAYVSGAYLFCQELFASQISPAFLMSHLIYETVKKKASSSSSSSTLSSSMEQPSSSSTPVSLSPKVIMDFCTKLDQSWMTQKIGLEYESRLSNMKKEIETIEWFQSFLFELHSRIHGIERLGTGKEK